MVSISCCLFTIPITPKTENRFFLLLYPFYQKEAGTTILEWAFPSGGNRKKWTGINSQGVSLFFSEHVTSEYYQWVKLLPASIAIILLMQYLWSRFWWKLLYSGKNHRDNRFARWRGKGALHGADTAAGDGAGIRNLVDCGSSHGRRPYARAFHLRSFSGYGACFADGSLVQRPDLSVRHLRPGRQGLNPFYLPMSQS